MRIGKYIVIRRERLRWLLRQEQMLLALVADKKFPDSDWKLPTSSKPLWLDEYKDTK